MAETEITVQCYDDLATIFTTLTQNGLVQSSQFQLNDWYWSALSNEALSQIDFAAKVGRSVLVREIVRDGQTKVQLVHKAKTVDERGNVVAENKTVANVDELDKVLAVFEQAGLNNWCVSHNTSYVFTKPDEPGCEFAVQVIEGLGTFIEFEEYPAIQHLTPVQKIANLQNQVQQFELHLGTDFMVKKAELLFQQGLH